ncbi:MAG: YkgJ family cysteine cluster protein [Spirochaetota bacterium]|nr:YkgJ family cysteine cluster protein [Spirochaetota bacterium]
MIRAPAKMPMKRVGECDLCGDCCRTLSITASLSNALKQHRSLDEIKLYYSHRNIRVAGTNPEKDYLFIEIDLPCGQLDEKGHCKIHSERDKLPFLCQNYPTAPDDIENCGYQFIPDIIPKLSSSSQ